MSETQGNIELVKDWLLARINKVIRIAIVQRTDEDPKGMAIWEGQGKVLRCTKPGVVLELMGGNSRSWLTRILHVFRLPGMKHVVKPWEQRRLSVPYVDLSLDVHPGTGETWLLIDAETWKRSPEELQQGPSNRNEGK